MKVIVPFIFYKIPEAFLLIAAALGLLGIRIRPGRLVLTGLGLGVLTEISRYYLFDLWLHTPVVLLGLIAALILGFGLSLQTAVVGCFLSYFLLSMGDTLLVTPILSWTGVAFQDALENQWLYLAFGWLSAAFLVIAVAICQIWHVALICVSQLKEKEQYGKADIG